MLALFIIVVLAVIPWALLWMLTCVRDKQPAFVPTACLSLLLCGLFLLLVNAL